MFLNEPLADVRRSTVCRYLHNKDILHRDLKSANLLIDPLYRVKVADFGLARQEAADPGDMTCETGTIRWMAPEVRRTNIEHLLSQFRGLVCKGL